MKNSSWPILVEPSLLSADFGRLAEEAKRAEDAGADGLHIDVMDGHFVPNLSFGPKAVAAVRKATNLFLDVHVMIYNPFDYVERFVEAGANRIIFHFEATEDVKDTLKYIRKCSVEAGLAFSPDTSASFIVDYLHQCDLILIMTVYPGFGGQDLVPHTLEKVTFAREACDRLQIRKGGVVLQENQQGGYRELPPFDIAVDGGIDDQNAGLCIQAGANVLVSGTYLFKAPEMYLAIGKLKQNAGHSREEG